MKHERISKSDTDHGARIDVRPYAPNKPVADMTNAEFADWMESMPPPPGLPSTDEEVAASVRRAEADIEAGRFYSHELVGRWLKTWGKPGRKPFREWLKSAG